jgi:hypothetical protein
MNGDAAPYDYFTSPANAQAVELEFSAMRDASAGRRKLTGLEAGGGTGNIMYDYDLVMIFPLRSGGEEKDPDDFTIDRFVRLLTGKDPERSQDRGRIVIDPFLRVLRTARCFLDDMGRDTIMSTAHEHSEKAEQQRLQTEEKMLEKEYERFVGSRAPATEQRFCELVAKAIARRVQLACGLTTRMFRSCDDDEVSYHHDPCLAKTRILTAACWFD